MVLGLAATPQAASAAALEWAAMMPALLLRVRRTPEYRMWMPPLLPQQRLADHRLQISVFLMLLARQRMQRLPAASKLSLKA